MIQSVHFTNFKALQSAVLPLGQFTLVVGPNGSGKSTALEALQVFARTCSDRGAFSPANFISAGKQPNTDVVISVRFDSTLVNATGTCRWSGTNEASVSWQNTQGNPVKNSWVDPITAKLQRIRVFSFDPRQLAEPRPLRPEMELGHSGESLAGVLDRLRDQHPERFEALNIELGRLLPEYDRILFDVPREGTRAVALRTRVGGHKIAAIALSQGTLLALALLTLAHLPDPPPLVGLEEPDHGLHPRLLRDLRDALYRLSYPESFGEKRAPVQVIATTHSPYFLDLFKDHPEEIVISEKVDNQATFQRLIDRADVNEILADAPLGEVWYSGVLGGVPAKS